MAATTNYAWVKPTVGASLDTWGTILNTAWDDADADLFAVSGVANAALPKAGGTMTGFIVLHADPDAAMKAATKQYVDTGDNLRLLKSGGTMTGPLVAVQASTASVSDSSSAGSITINCQDSNVFKVAMTENITSMTLSNPSDGQTVNVRFTQDATGSRTVSWPASFKWAGGGASALLLPSLSREAYDFDTYDSGGRNRSSASLLCGLQQPVLNPEGRSSTYTYDTLSLRCP